MATHKQLKIIPPTIGLALILCTSIASVQAATTDLSTVPLITSSTSAVLPNLMFVLDDSGSMAWDYMPDNAGNFHSTTKAGRASNHCNGVYYSPSITYTPPVYATGASYPNSSFIAAWTDGFAATGSVDLRTAFKAYSGDTAQAAYYLNYTGTQTTEKQKDYYNTSSTFYTECNSAPGPFTTVVIKGTTSTITVGAGTSTGVQGITVNGVQIMAAASTASATNTTVATNIAAQINACTAAATGACGAAGYYATVASNVVTIYSPAATGIITYTPVPTKTAATASSTMALTATAFAASDPGGTDQRTNFANWYSYYRTRILMMKTATGLAFKPIDNKFRVGFVTINNNNSDVLALNTFDATQKSAWYTKLYGAVATNSTPLREALSDVGRMYAHKLPASNADNGLTSALADPIQYSCQQNFTILSTDGFWNGSTTRSLSGGTVGNTDGTEDRPMYDGSTGTDRITTPYTTVQQRQTVTTGATTTDTYSRSLKTIGAACSTTGVAGYTPPNTMSAFVSDNQRSMALGLSATDPDPTNAGRCVNLASNAWICRGAKNSGTAAVSSSNVTDSAGTHWYMVSSLAGNTHTTGCQTFNALWGGSYSSTYNVCPGITAVAGVAGSNVTTTPQTKVDLWSGATTTSVDEYTANQSTTQTVTNGVAGPVSALTPSTLTYTFTRNVSTSSTTASLATGSWVNGTASTACVATASLPVSGSYTPDATGTKTTTSTSGTATTTTLSTVGPTAGTATHTLSTSGGTSNTLADVAEYYYVNDLRTTALGNDIGALGADVSANNVPTSGLDGASWQHMTTFTLGLGARGRMVFSPTYQTDASGDYHDVKVGAGANGTTVCSWQASGSCNWPTPASDAIENIDDLWHAAVNGRGTYFSATNPATLGTALSSALSGVSARTGGAAAATTSNPNVTSGDNFVFSSTFTTQEWDGELVRQQLDLTTGRVITDASGSPIIDWSAKTKLDAATSRTIYTYDATNATTKRKSFLWANLTAAAAACGGTEQDCFNSTYISTSPSGLTQLLCASAAVCLPAWQASHPYTANDVYHNGTTWYKVNTSYTSLATFGATDTTNSSVVNGPAGTDLVSFIRGDRTNEGVSTDNQKYYRQRIHILGDIVNAEAVYVKASMFTYTDTDHPTFITSVAQRQGMVYAASNDGMLHAFYSADGCMNSVTGNVDTCGAAGVISVTGGDEAWAYIPSMVLPNLYKLADKDYTSKHQYMVDGTPVAGEVCTANCTTLGSAVWKTILVGGLNGGGKGYYAMDITNPAVPKVLWEFTDTNMGYTYGNPKITKLNNGTWVVLVTSGYNNGSPGDGMGRLYVINAADGTLIRTISTGVGSVVSPSGLGRISVKVVNTTTDNTAEQVYGGDMFGNLWRFDVNGNLGYAGYDAQLLTTLMGSASNSQPITTKPEIGIVNGHTVVYVGTGRYLGATDLADTRPQTLYGIKDDTCLTATNCSAAELARLPSTPVYISPRLDSHFVRQTQTNTTCPAGTPTTICTTGQIVRTSTSNPVDFASNYGWYVDLPDTGERANTDPTLALGTLGFTTNVPNTSACTVGGVSYRYFLDYRTGAAVSTSTTKVASSRLGNALATRPVYVRLPNNAIVELTRMSDSTTLTSDVPIGASGLPTRRTSWRELTN